MQRVGNMIFFETRAGRAASLVATVVLGLAGGTCLHAWRTGQEIRTDNLLLRWRYGGPQRQGGC